MKTSRIYRPTTRRRSDPDPVAARHRSGRVCRRHGSADPAEEPAEAGAELSGRHQEDQQPALHQRRRAGRRADRRADEAGRDGRVRADGKRSIRCWCEAIGKISSPELRNASTIGGDMLQEVWCQYLRGGYSCWRNGGYICYGAIGDNSYYHSAMGGRLCYAVYPGDAATALIPFDATVKLATPSGLKELTVEQLVPGDMMVDGRIQSHVVRINEILTEVVMPPPKPDVRASFEKIRPRGVWDFAMASLAHGSAGAGTDVIDDARVVFGGIAGRPLRETAVERFPEGQDAERRSWRASARRTRWRTPRR